MNDQTPLFESTCVSPRATSKLKHLGSRWHQGYEFIHERGAMIGGAVNVPCRTPFVCEEGEVACLILVIWGHNSIVLDCDAFCYLARRETRRRVRHQGL